MIRDERPARDDEAARIIRHFLRLLARLAPPARNLPRR